MEKVTSKEAAVKKEEPAHIASMEKPAKPPDRKQPAQEKHPAPERPLARKR